MDWTSSPFYQTAVNAANAFGVPANLFTAQIGQESSFNPTAQNGNAYGIAQFMPATAQQYGVNTSDPTSSLYGAAQYDSTLYSQYGSWQTALQKYGTTANGAAPSVDSLAQQADAVNQAGFNGIIPDPFAALGSAGDAVMSGVSGATNTVKAVADGAASVGTLLGIITDIPRMITLIIGLLMLGAGLIMLRGGSPVEVVTNIAKGAAVAAA